MHCSEGNRCGRIGTQLWDVNKTYMVNACFFTGREGYVLEHLEHFCTVREQCAFSRLTTKIQQ